MCQLRFIPLEGWIEDMGDNFCLEGIIKFSIMPICSYVTNYRGDNISRYKKVWIIYFSEISAN